MSEQHILCYIFFIRNLPTRVPKVRKGLQGATEGVVVEGVEVEEDSAEIVIRVEPR
jgi:hypothetical protein